MRPWPFVRAICLGFLLSSLLLPFEALVVTLQARRAFLSQAVLVVFGNSEKFLGGRSRRQIIRTHKNPVLAPLQLLLHSLAGDGRGLGGSLHGWNEDAVQRTIGKQVAWFQQVLLQSFSSVLFGRQLIQIIGRFFASRLG